MKTLTAVCVVLFLASTVAGEDVKEAKFDAAKLVGNWSYVSGVRAGEKVDKEHLVGTVTFTKDTITLPAGPDAKFVMGYKADPKASPATIDMEIKDGPVKEGKALGIISVTDDELKLCYAPVMDKDTKRPTKFESTKDNGAFLFVLKREKK